MFKRLLIFLCVFTSLIFAYNQGGNANQPGAPTPLAGEVFVHISNGAMFVTQSNVVNVETFRILAITTNKLIILPGDVASVTMSVRNTGLSTRTITNAQLRMYTKEFGSIVGPNTPATYLINNTNVFTNYAQVLALAVLAGDVVTINFQVNVTTNVAALQTVAANPFVLDGYVFSNPIEDDRWPRPGFTPGPQWTSYFYGSDVTANWDTSGPPYVASIQVTPNPARALMITVTVNFSEWMDTTAPPSVNIYTNGNTFNISTGFWSGNTAWVGTYNIPAGQSTLYDNPSAAIGVIAATDNANNPLIPSYNVGTFKIITVVPTATISAATLTANINMNFPITLTATQVLQTPSLNLLVSTNTGIVTASVTFVSNVGGITWNGVVHIPVNTIQNTIATFNLPIDYADDAGNTNNVLLGVITVNIGAPIPVITTVNFDGVAAYNGIPISAEPYLTIFIWDTQAHGLDATSVRVTIDNNLVYSGPATLYQVASTPYVIYRYELASPSKLTNGGHTFRFGISDVLTMPAQEYLVNVNVLDQNFALVRDPVPFPNPFGSASRPYTEIVYQLTKAEDMYVFIYDLNGDLVWKKFIAKGQEGAHAGVNRVRWDGSASFDNAGTLSNGVYICHIISEIKGQKKTLGRTKIVILK